MKQTKPLAEILREFDQLPDDATVDQDVAAAFRGKKASSLERERWAGTGPRYVRDGRLIRYIKRDLVAYRDALVVTPEQAA